MLAERGIPGYSEPGQTFIHNPQLFDPVSMTNGELNASWPSNYVNPNVYVATAEGRAIMPALPVGADANLIPIPAAHADVGGSYNPQGVSAVTLGIARNAMADGGVPIAEVPANLRPDWNQMVVHSPGLDNYGNVLWSFTEGARYYEGESRNSPSVQAVLLGAPTQTQPVSGITEEHRVPVDPANPDGEQLTLREVMEADGKVTVYLLNSDGEVMLTAMPGHRIMRDPETGRITVTNGSGELLGNYTPPHSGIKQELQLEDLDIPALASQFAPGAGGTVNLGGAYGAGQINGFDILPFSENAHFLLNSEGDIVAELTLLEDGAIEFKNLAGESRYVIGDQVLTQEQYEQANNAQQANQAASAVGLMNSIIGLQHWDAMSELQRLAAVTSIYNAADALTDGNSLPGNLAAGASMLGLLSALDQGNVGAAMVSGISLVNSLANNAASNAIGAALNIDAANVVPGLGLILALDSGDPLAIVAAAVNFIPVYGQIISICITIFGGLFGDDDIPMSEGAAHAQWDAAGHLQIVTDQNEHGGGPTAQGWMSALAHGLQGELARHTDEHGNPLYGLVPNLLPTLGFKHDPDGFNHQSAQGHLFLSWLDENGQTQTRYYDGAGNRNDGTGETLAGDFMKHAMDAIAPAWAVRTTLAHWQAGEGMHLPTEKASLPQESADGITQTLQVLRLAVPGFQPARESLIDVDGDGYLEATQWVQANQAMLAIDVDGDGFIGAGELLDLQGGNRFNSLSWLDANGDGRMDSRDPAFAALRLWMDVNGDGISQNAGGSEAQTLTQARITAIDFATDPPHVEYADGRTQALAAQMLTADTLGVTYRMTEGGVLEISEQADGSGVAVLSAVNTREFDGQAGHVHGEIEVTTVASGDARLVGMVGSTIETMSKQTTTQVAAGDARLVSAAVSPVTVAQASVALVSEVKASDVRDNPLVFVPTTTSGGTSTKNVVASMVRTVDAATAAAASWATFAMAVGATASAAASTVAHDRDQPLGTWPVWTDEAAVSAVPPGQAPDTGLQSGYVVRNAPATTQAGSGLEGVRFVRERVVAATELYSLPASTGVELAQSQRLDLGLTNPVAGTTANTIAAPNAAPNTSPVAPAGATSVAASLPDVAWAAPRVRGERITASEDTSLVVTRETLLASASSSDGTALHLVSVQGAVHGRVSIDPLGHVAFQPEANFRGAAGFFYTVKDAHGLQSTAWASIDVASVNDAPQLQGEAVTGEEDLAMVFKAVDLLANDHDADSTTNGDAMHIARVGNATYGAVELRADGSVRFMPEDHHHGVASFNYWVADAFGAESMATVKLTLLSRNDAPVALGETLAGVEDRELSIASSVLLGNDRDADTATDGQALHIASVGNAMHGSVELRSDGEVIFTPEANYHGRAGFFYTVSDPLGLQSMAWASIDLAAVNDAPEAENQKATGEEDLAMVFSAAALLAAGSDVDAATDGDTLHMARVGDAVHGTVVLRADGSVRFLPEANYHGEASFNYWMADAHGAEAQARMSITVLSVNDVPVARGETLAGVEDSVLRIASSALLANDSDADSASGQTLYIASVSNATHGTVELRPGGEVAFTPEANYHGRAGFFYTVSDALGLQSTAWASIDLAAVNDAPEVQDDIATGEEDTVLAFSAAALLSRVSDVDAGTDGDTLRMARVGNAVHGTVEMSPDGSVRFMPEANYHGVASFSYWVADASGAESMASVNVTVLAVNDTPTARGDAFGGTEDKVLRIASATLLANDSDPDTLTDGQLLHIARVSNATHGTVELRPDGEVIFTPEPNYHGRAGFFYTVSDPSGLQSSAWASIDLTAVNDAPELQDDTALCDEDMAAVFRAADLLANDRDADVFTSGDAIRISRVGNAVHGTVELRSDGSVRFAPEPDYHGPASFNYWAADAMGAESMATVKLTVLAVNDAPLARGESMDVTEDEVLRIASATLLANDTDADTLTDGQGLRVAGVGDALHGTVELLPDGEVIFKPEENFHGVASFSYVVSDSAGGASTATAVLRIAPVNDAPQAVADMAATDEDRALVLTAASLLANDLDADTATNGDVMTLVRVGEALHGGVTLLPDGNVRFVPDANYHGPASFSYWVADSEGVQSRASVFITVLAVNDLPVTRGESFNGTEDTVLRIAPSTLLANDTDADTATDGQILHIAAVGNAQNGFVSLDVHGQIVFVPQPNHSGVASFQYTVSDGAGGMSIATAMVHLASVNDAPLARGEALTGEEDVALIFEAVDLLRNDSDPDIATDGDALRIARVGEAVHGAVELRADGSVRFVPETNYHGRASFSYWVTDAAGAESRATVQLTVLAVNDLPTARGETFDTTEDGVISIPQSALLGNDSDVDSLTDGQSLSIVSIGNARHGSATLDVNGRIRFLPEVNYHGAASFDYVISDGAGGTATATAVVRVSPLNDAPTPVADATRADEDQVLVFSTASLLANDSDPDMAIGGDVLRVVRVGNATHGTVTLEVGGNVRFVPEANYHGLATFTYWVADVAGSQSQAQVTIRLDPINDLPVLQGEIIEGSEDITLRIDPALLLANDTDVDIATDAQGLAITAVESGTHGSATLRWDGKIVFSPETDFSGRASFSYRVTDGAGGEVWAMAFVDLAAVNDAPVVRGEIVRATEDVALAINPALLLANDSDKDNPWSDLRIVSVGNATHGTVTLDAAGALHFVPVADYFGSASFDYTVGDGAGGFTVGTATIEIAPVNDAPVLVGETMTLDEDTQARFTTAALLANDADVDDAHATLSLTAVGNAAGGSVALVGGEIVFTPTLNRYGPASFTYTVSDAAGEQRTASVNLDFTSVNDKPVVNGETFVGRRNTTYTFTQAALLANDTDVEDPAGLRIVAVGNAAHGTATRMGDGSIRFTPQAGFTGTGSFDYVVEDPGGGRSTATTTIDFSRVNTAPVATDDGFIGFEDVAFRIAAAQLLVNDRDDEDPSLLRVTAVANGSNGSVSLDASGNVNFVPTANYSGGASFNYLVSDSDGASTWATAYLTVQSVNDAPVIEDIWYGRPFYGYRKEVHRDLDWGTSTIYVKVTDSATALAVLASGQSLYLQQNTSTTYAPSYYRNGMLKPVSIDPLDATHEFYLSDNGPYYTPMNDRFRQNGAVVAYDPDGNSAALTFSIGSAPQHGHAWTNRYIPSNVSEYIDHTQAAPFWIGERGAWQYYSRRGDSYSGGDPFTISVTDSGGATTRISINAVHAGSNIGGGGGCPIVIDLSDDGIDLIRPEDSNVFMDINGDGWRDRIGWAAPSDAVLVLDGNQDGRVDIDHEVSFVDHLPGARTDLEGLVAHDSDGDGRLTAADDRWKEFGLFQDRNRNGLQDEGEFISLDAAGLRSLSLLREGTPEMNQGNVVFGTSVIEWADGRISRAGDVMFAGDGVPLPEAAQMALLFSQLAALPALAEPAGAAVFLPPHAESMTDEWVVAASAATTPTPMAVSA